MINFSISVPCSCKFVMLHGVCSQVEIIVPQIAQKEGKSVVGHRCPIDSMAILTPKLLRIGKRNF